jgi:hypothetical protein
MWYEPGFDTEYSLHTRGAELLQGWDGLVLAEWNGVCQANEMDRD